MRICVPIPFRPEGGGQYFLQQFRLFLNAQGHSTTDTVRDRFDVLFTNHWLVSLPDIFRAIRRNPSLRLVQRIDGAATDYGRRGDADQRQHEVSRLADLTIFQSEYCRWSTRTKFPVITQDGPVIHNPVDLVGFTPVGPTLPLLGDTRMAAVTWSTNPKKGSAQIYELARRHPRIDFHLCGRYPDAPTLSNVHAHGVLDREQLPIVLRSCHAMVTFSENEACPNHVLEALASGLPVLYGDSGAMREVVGDAGMDVTVESFGDRLQAVARDWPAWRARSRHRAVACFDPSIVFARYLAAIEQARSAALRMSRTPRLILAAGGRASAMLLRLQRWDHAPTPQGSR